MVERVESMGYATVVFRVSDPGHPDWLGFYETFIAPRYRATGDERPDAGDMGFSVAAIAAADEIARATLMETAPAACRAHNLCLDIVLADIAACSSPEAWDWGSYVNSVRHPEGS